MSEEEAAPETSEVQEDEPETKPSDEAEKPSDEAEKPSDEAEKTSVAGDDKDHKNEDSPEEPEDKPDEQEPEVKEEEADSKEPTATDNQEDEEPKEESEGKDEENGQPKKAEEETEEAAPSEEPEANADDTDVEEAEVGLTPEEPKTDEPEEKEPEETADVLTALEEAPTEIEKGRKGSPGKKPKQKDSYPGQDVGMSGSSKGRRKSAIEGAIRQSFQENLASNQNSTLPVEGPMPVQNLRRSFKDGRPSPTSSRMSGVWGPDKLWMYAFVYVLMMTFLMRYFMCTTRFIGVVLYTTAVCLLALQYYGMGPLARGFTMQSYIPTALNRF